VGLPDPDFEIKIVLPTLFHELEMSRYQILQIFSIILLEKMPISCVLEAFDSSPILPDTSNQLILFEF